MGDDFKSAASVYDFTVKDGNGEDVTLEKYKGKVLLIVNIASKCGLTKANYKELTDLNELYVDKGKSFKIRIKNLQNALMLTIQINFELNCFNLID